MTFFRLAYRNVIQKFRDYLAYFISTTFAVMVFYIFYSIFYNPQMLGSLMVKEAQSTFEATGFLVAMFSMVFIWYSNAFFIRSRKKEIATYTLLGMEKRRIGRIIFFETIIMGSLAITCGVVLGTLFSKFTTMILVNILQEMIVVQFSIVTKALKNTIIVFAVIFLITSIHGYYLIYRFKLIDLFQAEKEGENTPRTSIIVAILAVVLIGLGYRWALGSTNFITLPILIGVIGLVVAGTYCFFRSMIVFLVNLVKKNKNHYYSGTNMLSISQIQYRIKGNVRILTTIATLSAITITVMATTYTMYKTVEHIVREDAPYTYMYKNTNEGMNAKVRSLIASEKAVSIQAEDDLEMVFLKAHAPGDQGRLYSTYVLSESAYRETVKAQGRGKRTNFHSDGDALFQTMYQVDETRSMYLNKTMTIAFGKYKRDFRMVDITSFRICNMRWARQTLVVRDNVYQEMRKTPGVEVLRLKAFALTNAKNTADLTEKLSQIIPEENGLDAYYYRFNNSSMIMGMLLFNGMFLGVLFLLATGSIIYFKLLMEAYEDKDRFRIMRNIGLSKSEMKRAVCKYIFLVFALPFILGASHSTAAIGTLQNMLRYKIFGHYWFVVLIYGLVYAAYSLITVKSYIGIIEKRQG